MKMRIKMIISLSLAAAIIVGPGTITSLGDSKEDVLQMIYDEESNYNIMPNNIIGGYYYNQLNDIERKTYEKLVEGAKNFEENINIEGISLESYYKAKAAFSYDHPEYFWMQGYSVSVNAKTYEPVCVKYEITDEIKENFEKINQIVNDVVNEIPSTLNDYEKTKYLYEWIVLNTEYDLESVDNQDITSVFINKVSVCAGYSKAFQVLCQRAGLSCTYVTGQAQGGGHAWNLMYIGGKYYYIDTTWGETSMKNDNKNSNDIKYDYFLTTDSTMNNTHELSKDIITMNNRFENVFTYPQ